MASDPSAVLSVVLDDFFFGFAGLAAFGCVGETTSPLTELTGLVGALLCDGDSWDPDSVVGDSVDEEVVSVVPVEELDSVPDAAESGSAQAGPAAIADPTPSATANAPTRPTYVP